MSDKNQIGEIKKVRENFTQKLFENHYECHMWWTNTPY
jgi:hypothetical protein